MLTFNEFYNSEKYLMNRNYLSYHTKKIYKSNWGKYLRNQMELEDFKNEVNIRLIKFWNYDSKKSSLNTYLATVINGTLGELYKEMERDKRKVNHIYEKDSIEASQENDEETIVIIYNDDVFNEENCIDYISNGASTDDDRIAIKMYLMGYKITEISDRLNIPYKKVVYKIKNKYKKMMEYRFKEYRNNI